LMYPERYSLEIEEENEVFSADLKIRLT
jgi:hypothetical protein